MSGRGFVTKRPFDQISGILVDQIPSVIPRLNLPCLCVDAPLDSRNSPVNRLLTAVAVFTVFDEYIDRLRQQETRRNRPSPQLPHAERCQILGRINNPLTTVRIRDHRSRANIDRVLLSRDPEDAIAHMHVRVIVRCLELHALGSG